MADLSPTRVEALWAESRDLLDRLADRTWSQDTYIAGSAALALYLDHRPVRDIDLMAPANRLTGPERRDLLADLLEVDDGFRVETARDGFLYARSGSGVGLKLFHYPYPLIAAEGEVFGLPVASTLDLGLMKIAAIISRGTRRDFVDLYLLCREIPLDELLDRSTDKFGHVRDFRLQALKGLADLSLVDGEPMPNLNREVDWVDVERWIGDQVRESGRRSVGLEGD